MTHDEMRFFRRELINEMLHINLGNMAKPLDWVKFCVRMSEHIKYGKELKAYE